MKRREFMRKSARVLLSALGVSFIGYPIMQFLSHSKTRITSIIFHPSETLFKTNHKMGVYLIKKGEGFEALSARCTHLGCLVAFDKRKGEFHCPCHGSIYDRSGKRLRGPAKKPLASLPFRQEKNGDLVVTLRN